MFEPRIRIDHELHARLQRAARLKGYSSVEEMIRHVLEKAAADADDPAEEEVRKRLRGLGYVE